MFGSEFLESLSKHVGAAREAMAAARRNTSNEDIVRIVENLIETALPYDRASVDGAHPSLSNGT